MATSLVCDYLHDDVLDNIIHSSTELCYGHVLGEHVCKACSEGLRLEE